MDLGGTMEVVRGRRHSGGGEERKEKHWIREAR
jgi:hypothetical protein